MKKGEKAPAKKKKSAPSGGGNKTVTVRNVPAKNVSVKSAKGGTKKR